MKNAFAILMSVALLTIGTVAHAKWIVWKAAEKPPVSLSDALIVAANALKEQDKEFYCIQANLGSRITAADWELQFGAPDGSTIWVNIGADRSTVISKREFFH